jgi:hypothetical protein
MIPRLQRNCIIVLYLRRMSNVTLRSEFDLTLHRHISRLLDNSLTIFKILS